jgi:hypothetical protein
MGVYKWDTGMSVEDVSVVKSVEKEKRVAGQFAVKYRSKTYYWTQ